MLGLALLAFIVGVAIGCYAKDRNWWGRVAPPPSSSAVAASAPSSRARLSATAVSDATPPCSPDLAWVDLDPDDEDAIAGIRRSGAASTATEVSDTLPPCSPDIAWVDLDSDDEAAIAVVRVTPRDRPLWELKGWKYNNQELQGFYEVPGYAIRGVVAHLDSLHPDFYVLNPPSRMRNHPHWACFHKVGDSAFWIHFRPAPENADEGILAVERLLPEMLASNQRRTS